MFLAFHINLFLTCCLKILEVLKNVILLHFSAHTSRDLTHFVFTSLLHPIQLFAYFLMISVYVFDVLLLFFLLSSFSYLFTKLSLWSIHSCPNYTSLVSCMINETYCFVLHVSCCLAILLLMSIAFIILRSTFLQIVSNILLKSAKLKCSLIPPSRAFCMTCVIMTIT